jgi:hypothetical protein
MSFLLHNPMVRPLGENGEILPGCYVQLYESGTTTPTPGYSDADLEAELTNPVESDSAGRLPAIYGDSTVVYRMQLYDADDVLLLDIDPIHPSAVHPPGTVVMFNGTSTDRDAAYPPSLWELCDGDNGTKDTRDRSPLGVSNTKPISGDGSTGGSSGGIVTSAAAGGHNHSGDTESHSLTSSEIPGHTHFIAATSGSSSNTTIDGSTVTDADTPYGGDTQYRLRQRSGSANAGLTSSTGSGGGHTHGIEAAADHTHDVDLGEIQSPYFTVWFLQRKP